MRPHDIDEAERYLLGLFDFERQKLARRQLKPFTLERVRKAISWLGNPAMHRKIIHIAGTKGKGSTALAITHTLESLGYRCGLFTSPHLISLRERIRSDQSFISLEQMYEFSNELHTLNQQHFDGDLTFFEFLFLMAMMHFESEDVEFIVLETGLGGRLDATNIVTPQMSVLTQIDYDHCDILGHTLPKIAGEKAGIIKTGVPVIALDQNKEVNSVFEEHVQRKQTKIQWVTAHGSPADINTALAKSAIEQLGLQVPQTSTPQVLPGRMHHLESVNAIFDTAHNPLSLKALATAIENQTRPHLLFAMAESRDPQNLLEPLLALQPNITFCELPGGRPGVDPHLLKQCWNKLCPNNRASVLPSHDAHQLKKWLTKDASNFKVVTGSFYIVGACYSALDFSSEQLFFS